ncbi:MAG: hypothetical protein H0X13_19860 [Ramlibacter sp.]|nr:hypothetical protein [Ramlibacter sp.]
MAATLPPLAHMTRDKANEILTLWKFGAAYPARLIDMALYVTGDLGSLR